jgi:hypothetical protein
MKTALNNTDMDLELSSTAEAARVRPYRRRRFAMSVFVVLMPLMFMVCFKACRVLLGNEAFASVSEDYNPAAFFRSADSARALHDKVLRNPQKVDDLGTQQILALFDHPALRRVEGPYRHWQYVSDSCVMDIYMKTGAGDEPKHPVQYVDFSPRRTAYYQPVKTDAADESINKVDCLRSLMQARVAGIF